MPYCTKCGYTSIVHGHPPRTVYWSSIREGSNIEVPNFRRYTGPSRFRLATGKSKKLYEQAVAMAFFRARFYGAREAVRRQWTAKARAIASLTRRAGIVL